MHIQTQSELESICSRAKQTGCVGIDSEFIPEHTYYPQLALVQIAVEEDCYIIDPLGELSLSPLEEILQSKDVIVIVHAGSQDMAIFFERTKRAPQNVFDTQLAASFLGLGHQVSYASMVHQLFGVSLKKGQSYTDWLKRPLQPQQEKYALEDVKYLIRAHQKMVSRLEENGRLQWVADELRFYEDADFYQKQSKHPAKRVKKTKQLDPREQVVLEALAQWREEEAQRRNLPRKKILSDISIVDLAKRRPRNSGELFAIRSAGYAVKRYGNVLLQTIASSRGTSPNTDTRPTFVPLSDEQKILADFLQFCLKLFCQKEKLSSSNVSTKSEIEELVGDYLGHSFAPERHRLLSGWRYEAVGKQMIECLEGKVGVKYDTTAEKLVFY